MTGDDGLPDGPELQDPDPDGLLAELLGAPDRDRCPGARPVVAVSEEDPAAYIAEVQERCVGAPRLRRRGQDHGDWAELADDTAFFPADPLPVLAKRWNDARPIVLHDALSDEVMELVRTDARRAALSSPGGLRAWAVEREAHLSPDFTLLGADAAAPLADERDVERVAIGWRGAGGPAVSDLWVKSQGLSTHPEDASLRVRFSAGAEVLDDASRDSHRHRLVAQLAERFVPELAALHRDGELRSLLGEWLRARPLLTQAICYWNAPGGGALFHHDAFDEPAADRQRGVLYAQLTGATAWLALSLDDLVARLREFVEPLEPADVAGLCGAPGEGATIAALLASDAHLKRELAAPGCGRLAPLVNLGPQFTSFLADAGHGYVVSEGDVIVLPNHGLESTCMHSVFCASEEPAFSLSLALRDARGAGDATRSRNRRSRRRSGRSGGRRRGGRGRRTRG
ncbi:MAG: hypothetical protein VX460_09035 [Planctomycetota bacterium]|nr:hypothetical protein [Planctomycetota bacterium]